MNLIIDVSGVSVSTLNSRIMRLDIEDADVPEILGQISLDDIIRHYGESEILEIIGKKSAVDHFGIEEKDD